MFPSNSIKGIQYIELYVNVYSFGLFTIKNSSKEDFQSHRWLLVSVCTSRVRLTCGRYSVWSQEKSDRRIRKLVFTASLCYIGLLSMYACVSDFFSLSVTSQTYLFLLARATLRLLSRSFKINNDHKVRLAQSLDLYVLFCWLLFVFDFVIFQCLCFLVWFCFCRGIFGKVHLRLTSLTLPSLVYSVPARSCLQDVTSKYVNLL